MLTDHHRRPTSIGGLRHDYRNRADVPQHIHRKWHQVVENVCAPKIVVIISNLICKEKAYVVAYRVADDPVHPFDCLRGQCCLIDYKKNTKISRSRIEAWRDLRRYLFKKLQDDSLEAMIEYINEYLIDPDYRLELV